MIMVFSYYPTFQAAVLGLKSNLAEEPGNAMYGGKADMPKGEMTGELPCRTVKGLPNVA